MTGHTQKKRAEIPIRIPALKLTLVKQRNFRTTDTNSALLGGSSFGFRSCFCTLFSVTLTELLNTASRVNKPLLSGEKWMTCRANFQLLFLTCARHFINRAACTTDCSHYAFGMNALFHSRSAFRIKISRRWPGVFPIRKTAQPYGEKVYQKRPLLFQQTSLQRMLSSSFTLPLLFVSAPDFIPENVHFFQSHRIQRSAYFL